MNQDQFNEVIDAIPGLGIRNWENKDIQMLFKILYWYALRFDEGVYLQYEQIHLEEKKIYLGKTKTEISGKAIIPEKLVDELSEWLADKDFGPLFAGKKHDTELSYNTAIRWVCID